MKKLFTFILSCLISLSYIFGPVFAEENADAGVHIIFTGGLRDHLLPWYEGSGEEEYVTHGGYSRLYSTIQSIREEDSLLLDAGNLAGGTYFSALYEKEAIGLNLLSYMGFQATTLGRNDIRYGSDAMKDMLQMVTTENPVPIISSNLNVQDSELARLFEEKGQSEAQVFERDGYRIGVMAITKETIASEDDTIQFAEAIEKAKETLHSLKEETDYIVCLYQGEQNNPEEAVDEVKKFARKTKDIDLIIDGSCSAALSEPEQVSDTWIVSSGQDGEFLGSLYVNPEDNTLISYDLIPIDDTIVGDPTMDATIETYRQEADMNFFRPYGFDESGTIATSPFNFTPVDAETDPDRSVNTGNLVSDAYARAYDTWYEDWFTNWAHDKRDRLQAMMEQVEAEKEASGKTDEEEEEDPRITAIRQEETYVRNAATSVTVQDRISNSVLAGNITPGLAYDIVGENIGTKGSELVLVFVKGEDLFDLCEYDATIRRKETGSKLFMSGIRYDYSEMRQDYNHVEEVYVNSAGYYIPVEKKELYPLVTCRDIYHRFQKIDVESDHILQMHFYDEKGNTLKEPIVLQDASGETAYEATAVARYISEFDRVNNIPTAPNSYRKPRELRHRDDDFRLRTFFKNTSKTAAHTYFMWAVGAIVVMIVIKIVRMILWHFHRNEM